MTLPVPRTLRATTILATLATAFLLTAVTAAPASASLGLVCPAPVWQPFTPWGDPAWYSFAPNGGFENGATGWTLAGGAKVVAGSEPFAVRGGSDRQALSIPAGARATSAPMCIGALSTKMRFFARNTGSSNARLTVRVIYDGGAGQVLGVADAGTIKGGRWQPSPAIAMLGGLLPLLTQDVRIRFVSVDAGGAWTVDDVYVDPIMHR
jgi:hypothetical protein